MYFQITQALKDFLKRVSPEAEDLEWVAPPTWEMGQLGLPLFGLAKELKTTPAKLASEWAEACQKLTLPEGVARVQAVGPYLNFHLNWEKVLREVQVASRLGTLFAPERVSESQRPVLLEYASPNLAKPLAFHHLRGTMVGHVLGNLLLFKGIPVIRYTYPGDMGAGFGQLCVGAEQLYGKNWRTKSYTIEELYQAYLHFQEHEENPKARAEAGQWAMKLETGDPQIRPFHDEVNRVTKAAFEETYKQLNVYFDVWDGEFNYANQTDRLLRWLARVPGVKVGTSEGAKVLFFENDTLPSMILVKSDGSTVYLARDILSALHRLSTYHPSQLVYVVGSEQTLHMQQLQYLLSKAGVISSNPTDLLPDFEHVPYGLISLKGSKMSTRKGTGLLLEDVIQEASEEMKKRMGQKEFIENLEQMAKVMGVGAMIFGSLSHTVSKNMSFRWDDILNVEGDTGPYIYYAYARLAGILRKMKVKREDIPVPDAWVLPDEPQVFLQLIWQLLQFHTSIQKALDAKDPSVFSRYLLEMAKVTNGFYHHYPIKQEVHPQRQATLLWVASMAMEGLFSGARLLNMELLEAL
jgi:arginyl-tRNA synthetase